MMRLQHHSPSSGLLIWFHLEVASIVAEGSSAFRYDFREESTGKEVSIVNAVIWTICEYVFLGGVTVEVQEYERLVLGCK